MVDSILTLLFPFNNLNKLNVQTDFDYKNEKNKTITKTMVLIGEDSM